MGRPPNRAVMTAVAVLAATLAACGGPAESSERPPVVVEKIDGSDLARLTLSPSAAERLDIQTATVEQADNGLVVTSAAVIIDPTGTYWVYTNPEPLVFVRHEIRPVIEKDQQAFFEEGPPVGTRVVITGVPELYGAEFGIGK